MENEELIFAFNFIARTEGFIDFYVIGDYNENPYLEINMGISLDNKIILDGGETFIRCEDIKAVTYRPVTEGGDLVYYSLNFNFDDGIVVEYPITLYNRRTDFFMYLRWDKKHKVLTDEILFDPDITIESLIAEDKTMN